MDASRPEHGAPTPTPALGSPYDRAELSGAIGVLLLLFLSCFSMVLGPRGVRDILGVVESAAIAANLAYLTHRIIRVRRFDYVIAFCLFVGIIGFLLMYAVLYRAPLARARE